MIVESPNKVKKIKSLLGQGWIVSASVGHIRDLPNDKMGFSLPEFTPQYQISKGKSKVVKQLKDLVTKADEVYLATDPDREGEAIAYHLEKALNINKYYRVTFSEITKAAIQKAISKKTQIDYKMVKAQEGRRVLDRIVGYLVSPELSSKSGLKLSAGRVQSPAVKLTVLRERQIQTFVSNPYYGLNVTLENGLVLELDPTDLADDKKHIFDQSIVQRISSSFDTLVSTSVTNNQKNINPRKAFTTSTLQQSASNVLKISPTKCMQLAQKLFEQGLITYHRTDSPNLSADGFSLAKQYLLDQGHTPQEQQLLWNISKDAQEAHEAVRPTSFDNEPDISNADEQRLYDLIVERTLVSAMPPGIDAVTNVQMRPVSTETSLESLFIASGVVTKDLGWRAISNIEKPPTVKSPMKTDIIQGEEYKSKSIDIIEKTTQAPSRFTEASLIKALEKVGIGRPSTYASILENIKTREYITVGIPKKPKDQYIRPTDLGMQVIDSINKMVFMNLDYTRQLEKKLDHISTGKYTYKELVSEVYQTVIDDIPLIDIPLLIETASCPKCSSRLKKLRSTKNKNNYFWVHIDDNHECDKFISDNGGVPQLQEAVKVIECDKCGQNLIRKYSKAKDFHFWVHETTEHSCENFIKDDEGSPVY